MVSWLPKLFLLAQDTNTVKSLSTRAWVARALACMKVLRPKISAVPWSLNTPCQIASCLCGFVLALWLVRPSPHQCLLWEAVHDPVPVSITTYACHSLHPCLPRRLCPVYLRIPSTHHIVNLPLFVEWMKDAFHLIYSALLWPHTKHASSSASKARHMYVVSAFIKMGKCVSEADNP